MKAFWIGLQSIRSIRIRSVKPRVAFEVNSVG
jgi:hypothetical protein